MSRVLAVVLGVFALLAFALATMVALVLPDQLTEFGREPEDVYLTIFWAIICFLVGVFSAAAALRTYRGQPNRRRDYFAVSLISGVGCLLVIMGGFSRVDGVWLIPTGLLCIGLAFAYLRRSRPQTEGRPGS